MRTLIVGTARTLAPLASAIGPSVVGRVVIDPMSTPDPEIVKRSALAHEATRVVVCLPAWMSRAIVVAQDGARRAGLEAVRIAPIDEQLRGLGASVEGLREAADRTREAARAAIDPATLLGRPARAIDHALVASLVEGKRVMVTGAGGSIGRELVLLCAKFGAARLVLVERSENALFEIDRTLSARCPGVDRRAVLHDVVDEARTRALVARERPDVVFHAAAHKHVPLMESHPADALENNLIGTVSIALAAASAGVGRFVLISTDKAVRPSSVMGATKRLAERFVQGLASSEGVSTAFSIVRFGNVLGSAGSVLPVWAAQIAEGGPITVTDARMTRYFMTIPEAAALVAQAGAQASAGASVFVLDMGEPIEIVGLAERFVRASGKAPVRRDDESTHQTQLGEEQVEIVFTGIRPGEKLHEALAYEKEALEATAHSAIRRLVDPSPLGWTHAARMIEEARSVLDAREDSDVPAWLQGWIGDACIPGEAVEAKASRSRPIEAA